VLVGTGVGVEVVVGVGVGVLVGTGVGVGNIGVSGLNVTPDAASEVLKKKNCPGLLLPSINIICSLFCPHALFLIKCTESNTYPVPLATGCLVNHGLLTIALTTYVTVCRLGNNTAETNMVLVVCPTIEL
jgi:hypothetical protein